MIDNSALPDKLSTNILKDGTKWLIVPSKIILQCVGMWPENQTTIGKLVRIIYFTCFLLLLPGQILYVVDNIHDLPKLAMGLSFVFLTVEIIVRHIVCYVHSTKLAKILSEVYTNFWSSNDFEEKLNKKLSRESLYLALYYFTYAFFALARSVEGNALSILSNELPLLTKCSICHKSPYYELFYIIQSSIVIEAVLSVCGFDFFVATLIINCSTQFRLLRNWIKKEFHENATRNVGNQRKLLKVIIDRHINLIRICKEIEKAITNFVLVQYLMSVGTICLSSFVAVAIPDDFKNSLPFFIGHASLTFAYCWIGENLSYESSLLSDTIYDCNWHLWQENKELKRDVVLLLNRSQKPITISVGGFGYLNLSTFLKLGQFTFSVFTFLNNMMNGQKYSNGIK